jgi:hypothetical protein
MPGLRPRHDGFNRDHDFLRVGDACTTRRRRTHSRRRHDE